MAKRRKRRGRRKRRPRHKGPAGILQQALLQLRRNNMERALNVASQVLDAAADPAIITAAEQLLAEIHFRWGVTSDSLAETIGHLSSAIRYTPEVSRLYFHRGIALWRQGRRMKDALEDLAFVVEHEPDRPTARYLCQLAHLATGRPWTSERLSPAEENTLRLVGGLLDNAPSSTLEASLEKPLLGDTQRMWSALIEMRDDEEAAPLEALQKAAEHAGRRRISWLLFAYRGSAAMRAGDRTLAQSMWEGATSMGLAPEWVERNLGYLLREEAIELSEEGRWHDLAALESQLRVELDDRILAETIGLAYFHLGYEAVQEDKWKTAVEHWRKAERHISDRNLAQNLALAEEALGNWERAAGAWRDMVRRRPRKIDHPDYLTDSQVSALWAHAGECHLHADNSGEAETCFKHAVEYAPEDTEARMKLVDVYMSQGRHEAAENELNRILNIDENHVEALIRLATLFEEGAWWRRNPIPLWKRVLELEPDNQEAREAVAEFYAAQVRPRSVWGYTLASDLTLVEKFDVLEEGLEYVPNHPKLLFELGLAYREQNNTDQALHYLLEAYRVAADANRVDLVGDVVHELVHLQAEEAMDEVIGDLRQQLKLLPAFWIVQVQRIIRCSLDGRWIERFRDEALALLDRSYVEETRASLLVMLYIVAYQEEAYDICDMVEEEIQDEAPASGAVEFLEAFRYDVEEGDTDTALTLLRKAKRKAKKAGDAGMLDHIRGAERRLRSPFGGFSGLGGLPGLDDFPLPDFF